MVSNSQISVTVCYALPQFQELIELNVLESTSVLSAIQQSGILEKYQDIDLDSQKVGIFGQIVSLDKVLQENDRVEIYRPLQTHPMDARRIRAKQQK